MSENQSQDEFKERLERLKNSGQAGSVSNDTLPKRGSGRGVRWVQILGFLLLAIVLGAAYAKHNHEELLAEKLAVLGLDWLGSVENEAGTKPRVVQIDTGRPQKAKPMIEQTYQGTIMRSPAVLAAGDQDIMVTDLFTDFVPDANQATPRDIKFFTNLTHCKPRGPAAGEKVLGVRLETAEIETQLEAFDKVHVAQKLMSGLKISLEARHDIRMGLEQKRDQQYTEIGQAKGQMKSVDLVLTDRSAPIFLVLQAMHGQVIWNLHLAPDVMLKHVLVISGRKTGISGLPDGVSYEVISPADLSHECTLNPQRQPQPHWIGVQKAAKGSALLAAQMEIYSKGYAAYNRWYQGAIGQDAAIETVSAKSAAHVLLGPKPVKKLLYHKIGLDDLLISKTDHLIRGNANTRAAQVGKLHGDLMRSALGGDIDTLWPELSGGNKFDQLADMSATARTLLTEKNGVQRLFYPDALNNARSVSYTVTLKMADLLQPDEMLPEKTYAALYAMARTPKYMQRFCPEILNSIGTRCAVGASRTKVKDDGRIEIFSRLYYAPSYDVGEVANETGAKLHSAAASIEISGRSGLLPANDAAGRQAYIKWAVNICEKMKSHYGNCVVRSVRFIIRPLVNSFGNPKMNRERLMARVDIRVFSTQSLRNIRARLEGIVGN